MTEEQEYDTVLDFPKVVTCSSCGAEWAFEQEINAVGQLELIVEKTCDCTGNDFAGWQYD
jgi:hypothetical protein